MKKILAKIWLGAVGLAFVLLLAVAFYKFIAVLGTETVLWAIGAPLGVAAFIWLTVKAIAQLS